MLSLSPLTVLPCSPVEQINAAHQAGFDGVGLRLLPVMETDIDVMGNKALRDAIEKALSSTGLKVLEVEVVRIGPNTDVDALAPMLQFARDIGARNLMLTSLDLKDYKEIDEERTVAKLRHLCDVASEHGMSPMLEFMAYRGISNLERAVRIAEYVNRPNMGVAIDALHLFRSGGTAESVKRIDPRLISCVQLCDAPAQAPEWADLPKEGRYGRLYPGEGGLPLVDLLNALPPDTPISVEIPCQQRAELTVLERATLAARSCRQLLERCEKA